MGEEFGRLAAIFGAARRLSPAERPAFLADRCGDDGALRSELEGLLAAHEAAGDVDRVHPALPDVAGIAQTLLADAREPPELLPSLEGFRVVSRLAEGGMGTVYVAEQARPRRRVALKVLRPEAATPEGLRRFEREADVLARLAHPGIAPVLLHGTTTGPGAPRPFLAMELVEGVPLTRATARLDLRARVAVLAEVAEAVAHAHSKGVIHRDLKPDNVLVQADGRPKVVDFGVARLVDDTASLATRAGNLVGTLAYMSPEQARGDAASVDTRSDVYALGVVAYEVLCGRHPLGDQRGTLTEIVRRILEERPPEPALVEPRLRGDLSLILRKALAKDPAERYAGASALADDLRRHLADEPILARPLTGAYQVRRFVRRHKALVAGGGAALALLVAGLALAIGLARDERHARDLADESALALRQALAERSVELAVAALRYHEEEGAARALDQVPPELRGWEWRHLSARLDQSDAWEPLERGPLLLAGFGPAATSWQASLRDGSRLVKGPEDAAPVRLAPTAGLRIRALAEAAGREVALAQGRETFRILDPRGETVLAGSLRNAARVQALAYTADGSRLALAQDGGQGWCPLDILDARTGEPRWRGRGSLVETGALAFSPDGRVLASAGAWDGKVRLFDLGTETTPRKTLVGHTGGVGALAFSPDGRRLATGSDDRTARVWDLATGTETARLGEHQGPVLAVAFSRGGDRLATAGRDGTVRVWRLGEEAPARILLGHRGPVHAVAFSAEGDALVSLGDDGRRTWRLGSDPSVLRVHLGADEGNRYPYVYAARFSPHGRRLASAGWDHTVRIVDLATGALVRTLTLDIGPVLDVRWSRDGRSVVGARRAVVRWDSETGDELARWSGDRDVTSVCALTDGSRLLTADAGGTVRLHDLTDLQPTATWKTDPSGVADLALAPGDAAFALLSKRGRVEVRGMPGGTVRWRGDAHAAGLYGSVAFSADGRFLATGGADRRVRLWDAATGVAIRTLEGHTDPVYALAWLPDGSRLFSGDSRGLIRIWDPRTGRVCLDLRGHESYVYRLESSPDGETIASASGDNSVRIWSGVPRRERR